MTNGQVRTVLRHIRRLADPSTVSALSDRQLLERFASLHEERAFDVLLQRHGKMVLGVCQRVLHDEHEAEDVFQATFLVLARKAGSERWHESVGPWLHEVAYRLAVKTRANAVRRQLVTAQAEHRRCAETLTEVAARELRAVLDEELDRLPEKYRAPVVLCYLEGKTNEQAAALLGLRTYTLKGRLALARERLRIRLTRRGLAPSVGLLGVGLGTELAQATVPPVLLASTARIATLLTAKETVLATGVSAQVASLIEGMLKTMFVSKLKTGFAVLLAVSMLAVGAGLLAHQSLAVKPADTQQDVERNLRAKVENPPPVVREKAVRLDQYGDPLPPGVIARMGTARFHHSNQVNSVAYSPDGKTVISTTFHEVCIWDAATGKELRRFSDFTSTPYAFVVSPDQKTVASTDQPGFIEFWDLATGKKLRAWEMASVKELPENQRRTRQIAYSPDGQLLATSAQDRVLRLWNAATGEEVRQLTGAKAFEWLIVFSPDGKTVAYGHVDNSIRLCETATGRQLVRIPGHVDLAGSICFSPDGKILASARRAYSRSGDVDCKARLWDVATGKELRHLTGHEKGIHQVAFAADGKTLASGSVDGTIRLWDVATGKELRKIQGHSRGDFKGVTAVAFAPDGKTLASGGNDQTIRQWDLATGQERQGAGGHQDRVQAVAFSPDGRTLASASEDKTVRLWDAWTGRELRLIEAGELLGESGVVGTVLLFSPDGRTLLTNCLDSTIRFWDPATGKELHRIQQPKEYAAVTLALAPDGKTLATSEYTRPTANFLPRGRLALWDVATGKELRTLSCSSSFVGYLAFAPDGQSLLGLGANLLTKKGRLHVWETATGKEERGFDKLPTLTDDLRGFAVSGDGRWLAFSLFEFKDKQAEVVTYLWDIITGKVIHRFTQPFHRSNQGLAFSPDNRVLAALGHNGTVHLWDIVTGKERRCFTGQRGSGRALAFSADGALLASGSYDTTALVWDVAGRLSRKKGPLTGQELAARWAELAGDDAARADQAIWTLAAVPEQTLPLLRERLQPATPADPQRVARLIGDLNSDRFAVRRQGTAELEKLGDAAEPALRQTLTTSLTLEMRQRIEQLLEKITQSILAPAPERLRTIRALEVLEHIGTAEARRLLETLSRGTPDVWLTREAKTSLERLARRFIKE
jgi:RNA polymerase sigma factor (sigma-70 family)